MCVKNLLPRIRPMIHTKIISGRPQLVHPGIGLLMYYPHTSKRILGKAGGSRLRLGYAGSRFAGDLGGFAETPIGEAAQDAISTAVTWIAQEMEDYEITANVVMVRSPEMIVINRGESFGVQEGDTFLIREKGEILTDPATGEILDVFEGAVTGKIKVNRVSENVAYAELIDGVSPARGDALVFER